MFPLTYTHTLFFLKNLLARNCTLMLGSWPGPWGSIRVFLEGWGGEEEEFPPGEMAS